jgi:Short C-terminal domain
VGTLGPFHCCRSWLAPIARIRLTQPQSGHGLEIAVVVAVAAILLVPLAFRMLRGSRRPARETSTGGAAAVNDTIYEMAELADRHQRGELSDEEFADQRARLLGRS